MFDDLPSTWNIFATSASTANQSSYATYWDDKRSAYLGDEYSVAWMEDSDIYLNRNGESLERQFRHVKRHVNHSQPQQFGDKSISRESIFEFQTENNRPRTNQRPEGAKRRLGEYLSKMRATRRTRRRTHGKYLINAIKRRLREFSAAIGELRNVFPDGSPNVGRVMFSDSRDVKMHTLKNRLYQAMEPNSLYKYTVVGAQYAQEMQDRIKFDYIFNALTMKLAGRGIASQFLTGRVYARINHSCLKEVYGHFQATCEFSFSDYALKYVRSIVNLCTKFQPQKILGSLRNICEQMK